MSELIPLVVMQRNALLDEVSECRSEIAALTAELASAREAIDRALGLPVWPDAARLYSPFWREKIAASETALRAALAAAKETKS